MALFKMGAFAESLRGKTGNSVFLKTKSGTVVRDLVIPSNPKTAAQQGARSAFTKATQAFKNLTPTQVAAWNQYASGFTSRSKAGKLRPKTGINVFAALASKFLQVSPTGTIPLTPPTSAFSGDAVTLSAVASTGLITITASGANASGVTTDILIQPLKGSNRKPAANAYRHNKFVAFTGSGLTTTITLPVGYYAVAYRFVKTSTGQESPLQFLPVVGVTLALEQGSSKKTKAA